MKKLYTQIANGLLILHLCLVSSIPVKVNRCPTKKTERDARAIKICSSIERYHCLYDSDDVLVEDCIDHKQLPPGNYPIYNTFATSNPIDYKPCPRHKYQPWPAKSYEITECIAQSSCTSEGQIMCKHGNVTTDISCTCENKYGYASLSLECCQPYGKDDCSCFRKCTNNKMELDNNSCMEINSSIAALKTIYIPATTSAYYSGRFSVTTSGTVYLISVTALICILCLGCCVGMYMMCCVYEIQVECTIYNEEYEIDVFKLLKAAKEGNLEKLKGLAEKGYIDMADVDYDQRSALHLAACEGHVKTVQYLLENNFCNKEATDRWNRTVMDDVMWHQKHVSNKKTYPEIIRMIEKYELPDSHEIAVKKNIWHAVADDLISAAEAGNLLTLKRLKNNGTDMDLSDYNGRTALHAAAENGIEKVVNYLIDICGVSPFKRFQRKRPIDLLEEIDSSTNQRIREKLQKTMENMLKADECEELTVCHIDEDVQINRLFNCAGKGDIKRIRSFQKASYNMKLCDYDDRTVLHIAVSENQEHIVDYLLEKCDLITVARTAKDRWNMTPLEAAEDYAMPVVYNVFLKYCKELIDTESDDYRAFRLITAAAKGDTVMLERFNKKKFDMNLMDYDRRTALHLAAAGEHLETVKYLVLTAQVDIISDRSNRYPADESKNKEILDCLQTAKQTHHTPPSDRISPATKTLAYMMDAASKGKLHLIKDDRYKYQYFTMDSTDYFRNTPLHVAAVAAKLDDVEYLLNTKLVSPFVRNGFGETPLDIVNRKIKIWGLTEDCTKPQPYGAEEQKRMKSRTDEFVVILKKLESAMKLACTEDVTEDVNFVHHTEDVRIFLFLDKAYKGDIKAIRRYIKTDRTLVNKANYDKRSALHIAAAEGHFHLVKFLLEETDVDVNAQDRWKVTPLMEAMRIDDQKIIELLQQRVDKNYA